QAAAGQVLTVVEKDPLYPRIAAYDTIPTQFAKAATPKVTARVVDRDSTTSVKLRYRTSVVDTLATVSMTRDSLRTSGQEYLSYWRYTLPALATGSTNSWRIVASDPRGATDSTPTLTYSVSVDSAAPVIQILSAPDSVLADTAGPYLFSFRLTDGAGVKAASLRLAGQTRSGGVLSVQADTTVSAGASTLDWTVKAGGYALGSKFIWYLTASDILNLSSGTDTASVRVGPRRGKATLSQLPVSVADILRLVYIVLGRVSSPGPVDTLGLDLDKDGKLDLDDLDSLLTVWQRTSPALLSGGPAAEGSAVAVASLADEAAAVVFNLENREEIPWALVELEFTAGEPVSVELEPGGRLNGLVYTSGLTSAGKVLVLVLPSVSGKGIPAGSGELFRLRRLGASRSLPLPEVALRLVKLGSAEVR
ncbi:MAG TPA: hypothetical protein VJ417_05405, partial [Candidatus Glassbacteria bacterium]|nr:hypothetical protein [Candidatus Glassbacteria bacterium]